MKAAMSNKERDLHKILTRDSSAAASAKILRTDEGNPQSWSPLDQDKRRLSPGQEGGRPIFPQESQRRGLLYVSATFTPVIGSHHLPHFLDQTYGIESQGCRGYSLT